MKADEILSLISPKDDGQAAQIVRGCLQNGGGQLAGLVIVDGYVTEITTQTDESTAPFEIESDTYEALRPGVFYRTIRIVRNEMNVPEIDADLTKPEWPRRYGKGGKRPGAGRKPAPVKEKRVTMSIRITPEAKERFAIIATRERKSASRLLEDFIAEAWKNLEDGEN